jgi:hypothetical protein
MGRNAEDLTGRVFGKLKVLERRGSNNHGSPIYLCQCACDANTKVEVLADNLRRKHTKSCGCLRRQLLPYKSQYLRLLSVAQREGHPVDVSYEDFLEYTKQSRCHYCEGDVVWFAYGGKNRGYNLDRKDNSLGYTKPNVVVACNTCNRAKGNRYSYEEWVCMTTALKALRLSKESRAFVAA